MAEVPHSTEYVKDIVVSRHSLTPKQADRRVKHIIPHVEDAISFIDQARSGPEDVSFLPAYYAILNLSKVYILLGPRHADLPKHRWHGAVYDVHAKDSHSVKTECITLMPGGALPLLYETLTGRPVRKKRTISMGDVCSRISDISAEYQLATGKEAQLASLVFGAAPQSSGFRVWAQVFGRSSGRKLSLRNLPCLGTGFSSDPSKANMFMSPPLLCQEDQVREHLSSCLREQYLYFSDEGYPMVALQTSQFPMPEEFPIALLFFHMSSVVRYKPEFLRRIQKSRWWPMLTAAQRHSMFKFMLLFWSFVHKEQLLLWPSGSSVPQLGMLRRVPDLSQR